jgi:hypothetical protein
MKDINTKVIWIAPGYRAIIVANNNTPYSSHLGKILPKKDYIIMMYKNKDIGYNGTADVFENEILEDDWIEN